MVEDTSQTAPLADWIWFKSPNQSPFRLLFQKPGDRLSILSSYALSYQVRFEALPESDLVGSPRRVSMPSGRSSPAEPRYAISSLGWKGRA